MLIEKKPVIQTGDIVSLRTVGGEEILARVVAHDSAAGTIIVTKPIVAQVGPVAPGQLGIAFAPFMMTADEDAHYEFSYANLAVRPMKARKDLASKYLEMTTSIVVPSGSGIIKG